MEDNTTDASTSSFRNMVVYPSPVLVAGPLLMALSLVAGGVVRGTLLPKHSTPALLLFALSFVFSRWFRRAAVVFTEASVSLRDKTVNIEDISRVVIETGDRRAKVLSVYDHNGVSRFSLSTNAYGAGLSRMVDTFRDRLPEDAVSGLVYEPNGRKTVILWGGIAVLCGLALVEGFTGLRL